MRIEELTFARFVRLPQGAVTSKARIVRRVFLVRSLSVSRGFGSTTQRPGRGMVSVSLAG